MPELQNIPAPKSAFHTQIQKLVQDHRESIDTARSYLRADYSAIELRMLVQQKENGNARS
jgi:DNA polymerase I-like protein with 3'-5' exonuclease and polymerase domains